MFKRKTSDETEVEQKFDKAIQRTSAVNAVHVDVEELSAAVQTINRYKLAFGDHMRFYAEGGRLKIEIAFNGTATVGPTQ